MLPGTFQSRGLRHKNNSNWVEKYQTNTLLVHSEQEYEEGSWQILFHYPELWSELHKYMDTKFLTCQKTFNTRTRTFFLYRIIKYLLPSCGSSFVNLRYCLRSSCFAYLRCPRFLQTSFPIWETACLLHLAAWSKNLAQSTGNEK